jgi:hypothetical protein
MNADHEAQDKSSLQAAALPIAPQNPGRIEELEKENLRLKKLIAELLIKNQKLRAALEAG